MLHRIDPEQGIRRFYSLMIERDLFGTIRPVRHWGRIGTSGQGKTEEFASEDEAGEALQTLAQAKRRRGIVIYEEHRQKAGLQFLRRGTSDSLASGNSEKPSE